MSITDFAARLSPTPIPWWIARVMSWGLAVHAFVTGWDYLHTPAVAASAKSLSMVVQIATLHTWGIWFVVAGCILTLGLLLTRHALVWLGHLLCTVLYAGFAVATLQALLDYAGTPLEQANGPVWRAASSAFLLVLLHAFLCVSRGPIPKRGEGL